jgi:hypothetical protein
MLNHLDSVTCTPFSTEYSRSVIIITTTHICSSMTLTICAGCNQRFTYSAHSHHLSLTTRSCCRAHYLHHLNNSTVYVPQGVSGPDNVNPSGGDGPEIGDPSKYTFWLDHASKLTLLEDVKFDHRADGNAGGELNHMDVDSVNGADFPAPTETQDHSHPGEDRTPFIKRFPLGLAGAPISDARQRMLGLQTLQDGLDTQNIWHPFRTQRDWEFAQWAKDRGPSSTAVTELLLMEGVRL